MDTYAPTSSVEPIPVERRLPPPSDDRGRTIDTVLALMATISLLALAIRHREALAARAREAATWFDQAQQTGELQSLLDTAQKTVRAAMDKS